MITAATITWAIVLIWLAYKALHKGLSVAITWAANSGETLTEKQALDLIRRQYQKAEIIGLYTGKSNENKALTEVRRNNNQ